MALPAAIWSSYSKELYASSAPPLGTVDLQKLEDAAREHLIKVANEGAFMYVFGSAGTGSTYTANRRAFEKWAIVPRMLRNCTVRSLETTIFGVKHPSPVFVAPIGVQGILHPDAELGSARAAKELNVPFIMSTASSRSIEEVAEVNGASHRWYQLYWPYTDEITLSILRRIKANNFTALVVTLDTMTLGWRPHDLDSAYLPFAHGFGAQIGTSDPVFMARYGLQPETGPEAHPKFPFEPAKLIQRVTDGDAKAKRDSKLGQGWIAEVSSGRYRSWDELKFLRDNWEGSLVLKGIQCVEDAELALDAGVNGIIVSNHGGRQLDGGIASLSALENICQSPRIRESQANGKLTVLFDSSIRTGSDIIKAMALGAQAVLIGRPFAYGLALGGAEGVAHVIRTILADTEVSLGLSGHASLSEIQGKGEEIITKVDC